MDPTEMFLEGIARDIRERLDGWDPGSAVENTIFLLVQEVRHGQDCRYKGHQCLEQAMILMAMESTDIVLDAEDQHLAQIYDCFAEMNEIVFRTLSEHPIVRQSVANIERMLGLYRPQETPLLN